MEQDLNAHRREDYYLAQIAAEIRRVLRKNPAAVKLEHFLLKFKGGGDNHKPLSEVDKKQRVAWSKARWTALVFRTRPRDPP
jgi:hypothetical protein